MMELVVKLTSKASAIGLLALVAVSCSGQAENKVDQAGFSVVEESVVGSATPVETAGIPAVAVFKADEDSFDFGSLKEGEKVEHVFEFINAGEAPLIINNVNASCGCTTPEYSKTPIAPGEKGNVKVVFDSNGQVGKQHKIITVSSNAENKNMFFHLRGEVNPK